MITSENKSINFIKKEDLTGSYKGMRYLMKRKDEMLITYIWPEPFCFNKTEEALITSKEFELSTEGKDAAIAWLNEQYETRKPYWDQATTSFYDAFKK